MKFKIIRESLPYDISNLSDYGISLLEYLCNSILYSDYDHPYLSEEMAGTKFIANSVVDGLIKNNYIDFTGLDGSKLENIIAIGKAVRDSRFETCRYILFKDNKIIGVNSVSSKLPALSFADMKFGRSNYDYDSEKTINKLRSYINNKKIDSFALLHNHPAGTLKLSSQDIDVANFFRYNLKDAFLGSYVVTDTGITGYIYDENGNPKTITYENIFDSIRDTSSRLIDKQITNRSSLDGYIINYLANFMAADKAIVIYINIDNKVTAVQEFDKKLFNNKETISYIRNEKANVGAVDTFLVADEEFIHFLKAKYMSYPGRIFADTISYDTNRFFGRIPDMIITERHPEKKYSF